MRKISDTEFENLLEKCEWYTKGAETKKERFDGGDRLEIDYICDGKVIVHGSYTTGKAVYTIKED